MSLPLLREAGRRQVLQQLRSWCELGWLRRLDLAFAGFLAEADPHADPQLLLAVALLAHLEGLGHACLDLRDAVDPVQLGVQPALAHELLQLARQLLDPPVAPGGSHGTELARAWREALQGSRAVRCVEHGDADADADDQGQPLVLEHERLYLRRYRDYECRLAAQWLGRMRLAQPPAPGGVATWMDRLFVTAAEGSDAADAADGADWQRIACALALRHGVSVITGGPGTGKTFTAARLLVLALATAAQPEGLRIALAAPTGKAAARLKQSIDAALRQLGERLRGDSRGEQVLALAARIEPARTLHALLGASAGTRRLRHHAANPLDVDLLLVDEASMVHLEMMADLLDALPQHARLVLLGDRDQLASVEAGAVLGELCAHARDGRYTPDTAAEVRRLSGQRIDDALQDAQGPLLAQSVAMLRRSRRFGGGIAMLAEAVNRAHAQQARAALLGDPQLHWQQQAQPRQVCELVLRERGLRECLERVCAGCDGDAAAHDTWALRALRDFDSLRVLCAVRQGPWGVEQVNRLLEQALRARGLLGDGDPWYAGRAVMVTRNDPDLGLFNGDIGLALRAADGALRVAFAQAAGVRWIAPGRLAHVETAFAMTVHKSQGSEFGHVVLMLGNGPSLSRELLYTAVTRARERLSLLTEQPQLLEQCVARVTRRSGGLLRRLQG